MSHVIRDELLKTLIQNNHGHRLRLGRSRLGIIKRYRSPPPRARFIKTFVYPEHTTGTVAAIDHDHFASLMFDDIVAVLNRQTLDRWVIDDLDVCVNVDTMGYRLELTMVPQL